jgi:hypothetical protein
MNPSGPLLIKFNPAKSEGICHHCGGSFFEFDLEKLVKTLWEHIDIAHLNPKWDDKGWLDKMPGP